MQRIRIHYKKGEALQYIGNLDLHKVWERIFRRAQVPLAYSQGFHPQPRIHQACPLPLGFTSRAELLDFWCESDDSLEKIQSMLEKSIQPGIEIKYLESIPLQAPALQNTVQQSDYVVTFTSEINLNDISQKIENLLLSEKCIRIRREKPYDLRSLITHLALNVSTSPSIEMRLFVLPGATGRPEEVLEELGISPFSVEVERTNLIFCE